MAASKLGGEGFLGVTVGRKAEPYQVKIRVWHTGAATGGGNSAYLRLFRDGSLIREATDSGFENYGLHFETDYMIDAASHSSFSIALDNRHATTATFGIEATIAPDG